MPIEFTQTRWQQIQPLLDAVLELPEGQQEQFLSQHCGGDQQLYHDVKQLLKLGDQAPDFLDQAAIDMVDSFTELAACSDDEADNAREIGTNSQIGSYVLREKLGRGGMGVVYRAERNRSDFEQQVAIKFLTNWRNRSTIKERFQREQQLLASLDHPNIARLYDGGLTAAGQPYLVMEFVSGKALNQYCDANRLSIDERLRLVLQIISALSFAHSQLIVHRDIKPSNILVTESGDLKLLDFGVAKLIDEEKYADLTVTGEQVMTPGFAAPEQLQNLPITVATDIYQLGLVIYQLVTGRQAYQDKAGSFMQLVKTVCHEQATLPSLVISEPLSQEGSQAQAPDTEAAFRRTDVRSWKRQLQGDLDAIILKMLSNQPRQRYPSMDALQADILAYFEHRPITAHTQNFIYRTSKALRRHWRAIAVSSAFLSLLIAYAVTVTLQSQRVQSALDISVIERQKANSVADFMQNIFKAADPNVSGLEKVTAKELLEQGQQRIDQELLAVPAIQGHMLTALGEIYYSQGDVAKSKALLIDALAKQRAANNGNELGLAHTLTQLAIIYSTTNDYLQADAYFKESKALYQLVSSSAELAANIDYAELANAYGLLLIKKGELDQAERSLNLAVDILQRETDGKHSELAVTLNNLAHLKTVLGELELAKNYMQDAIKIHEHTLGEGHSYFTVYLVNYGNLLTKLEDYDQAEPVLQRALSLQTELLGESHPYVSNTLRNLGVVAHASGKLTLAESYLRKALAIRLANSQRDTLMTATVHLQLAAVLRDATSYAEAETHLQKMREMHTKLSAGDHILGLGLCGMAKLQYALGDFDQAQQIYTQALELLGAPTIRRSIAQIGMAETLIAIEDISAAREQVEQALVIRQKLLPVGHGQIVEAEAVVALLAAADSDKTVAMPLLRSASDALSELPIYQYGDNSVYKRVQVALQNAEQLELEN